MDVVLAILVLGAVIFFGALISVGNERQRKALDAIREQTAQWAVQDLRLKREKLARDVKVEDPIAWLNQAAAKVLGEDLGLSVAEVFDQPAALVCTAQDGGQVVFSPLFPADIQRVKREKKNKLSRAGDAHPLMHLPKGIEAVEMSILNAGLLFDLELPLAWKMLSGLDSQQAGRLSLYRLK